MKHSVQELKNDLDKALHLVGHGTLFSMTAEERQALETEGRDLLHRLDDIESGFLIIGLLGGTGVGKSSLMNVLAGSEIAAASHRRPHTDHVLIYRHEKANPLPDLALSDVPWREITHRSDAIQYILLCDMPDYDSLVGEHRQHVLNFLEHLDILIWVTSPEKYADGKFYEFLRLVPKAEQNFYFVLNKVDLLFQNETREKGYDQLEGVVRSLQEHIRKNGIEEPVLYALSAKGASNPDLSAPWDQRATFRQQIYQQRNVKQITAIKAANLDVEVRQHLSAFQKETAGLKMFERILEQTIKEVEEQRPSWVQAGREAIDLWLEKYIHPDVLAHQADLSVLVGPGYGIALLLEGWRQKFTKPGSNRNDPFHGQLPENISVSFKRRLEWLEERLNHRILHQNLPISFRESLKALPGVSKVFEDLMERFSHTVQLRLAEPDGPAFRGFKVAQSLTYALFLALFLIAVGGETAWQGVIESPGPTSLFRLIISWVHNLFSTKGLAALGSFALINLFLAIRFYRSYRRRLRRAARKLMESLKSALERIWQETLDVTLEELKRLNSEIETQRAALVFTRTRDIQKE